MVFTALKINVLKLHSVMLQLFFELDSDKSEQKNPRENLGNASISISAIESLWDDYTVY